MMTVLYEAPRRRCNSQRSDADGSGDPTSCWERAVSGWVGEGVKPVNQRTDVGYLPLATAMTTNDSDDCHWAYNNCFYHRTSRPQSRREKSSNRKWRFEFGGAFPIPLITFTRSVDFVFWLFLASQTALVQDAAGGPWTLPTATRA